MLWWLILASLSGWTIIALFPGARSFGVTAAAFAGWRLGDALVRDPHFIFDFLAGLAMLAFFSLGGLLVWTNAKRFKPTRTNPRSPTWGAWRTFTLMAITFVACREIGAWHSVMTVVTTTMVQAGLASAAYATIYLPSLLSERRQEALAKEIDDDLSRMRAQSSQHQTPAV